MSIYPARHVAGDQLTAAEVDDFTLNPKYTYGETISVGDCLYLKASDGKAWKLDADVLDNVLNFIGFAAEAGVANDTKYVLGPGKIATGLTVTAGTIYYASNTAGGVSSSEGTFPLVVGIGVSSTTLLIAGNGARKMAEILTQQNLGNGTAGETIAVGDALYLKASDGKLWKTDADADESTYSFCGIAQSAASADGVVYFAKPGGIAKGLSALTAGSYYFLSGTAAAIATTPHATRYAKVAQALSTTTVRVIEPKFIRVGTISITSATTFATTIGFYAAKIQIRAGATGGGTGISIGDDSNNCVRAKLRSANNDGDAVAFAWSCIDANIGTTTSQGSLTARDQTSFTLTCSTYAATVQVQYVAESL